MVFKALKFSACAVVLAALFMLLAPPSGVHAQQADQLPQADSADYTLGTGDKVRVTVFGEDDLGGEFQVDGSGYLRLPLIGQVKAAGLSVRNFETQVKQKLEEGQYLKDAKVNVEVLSYRPFYIMGEVNKPGEYPYVNDMSVLTAVALAGGYTYRANDSEVLIRRNGETKEQQLPADETTKVHPGDIIRIPERFF